MNTITRQSLERWVSELDEDGSCNISDRQVEELIRGFAKLNEQCDQLAAENAALINFIEADCWVIDPDRDEYIDAVQCVPEKPATAAWQREQMAKGVEMAMDSMQKEGCLTFGECYTNLATLAAQLRNWGVV